MKILYIHSSADLYGSDKSLLRLIKYGDRSKISPVVCLPYKGSLVQELAGLGVPVHIFDMGVIRRKSITLFGMLKLGFTALAGVARILSVIGKEKIDIVHTNTSVVFSGAVAAKLSRIPHIWHVREIFKHKSGLDRVYTAFIDHFSDKIICVSEAVKQNLISFRKKIEHKITVVHNGIDYKDYSVVRDRQSLLRKYGLPAGRVYLGAVGRINRVKGYESLLRMACIIVKEYPDAFLIIAGDVFSINGCCPEESRKENLLKEAKRLNIENNVRFLGYVKEIEEIFSLMDIYLFTSIEPDSFPTTILEAMAAGKPVVANNIGGAKEIVIDGRTGFLVRPGDEADFVGAAERLLSNEKLRKDMGISGRDRCVKEFSVQEYVSQIIEVYKCVGAQYIEPSAHDRHNEGL